KFFKPKPVTEQLYSTHYPLHGELKIITMSNRFKAKFNIKKGDTVVVISGDDKDLKKPRTVLEVFPEKGKILVEGVSIVTKHTKPSARDTKGGIVKREAAINISNVMLW